MNLMLNEIAEAVGGRLSCKKESLRARGVSTDSRTIAKGNLFVALVGETHDGHDHIADVARKGAVAAIVQKDVRVPEGFGVIRVKDTLRALGDLAFFWRRRFPETPMVAVTGSNGKTTTKDLIAHILASKYRVLKTQGNLNNLIGLPLTLLRLTARDEIGVIEMGMNRLGEIDRLAEITGPQAGVITNIARAHLEGLKTLDNIAKAKGELLGHIVPGGLSVLPRASAYYARFQKTAKRRKLKVASFGPAGDYRALGHSVEGLDGLSFRASLAGRKASFTMPVLGDHNVSNALAALAIADFFKVPVAKSRTALRSFRLSGKRMEKEILKVAGGGVDVINDCYNANPDSTLASLSFLKTSAQSRRRIAVLGEMLELGPKSSGLHREVGRAAAKSGVHALFAVGPHASAMVAGARAEKLKNAWAFPTVEETLPRLKSSLQAGDLMLVKGSRGMKMEKVVQGLKGGGA